MMAHMAARFAWLLLLVVPLAGLAGCDNRPPARACMVMGRGPILSSAVQLDARLYPEGVKCQGSQVAANPPAPVKAIPAQAPNAPLVFGDVPPGRYTVAINAYSDNFGRVRIGGACVEDEELLPGQDVCLDLTLTAP
jgi:hypothetical protein